MAPEQHRLRRAGVAEIELIVSCFLLISLLLLGVSAAKIGLGRLSTARTAQYEVFHDANSVSTPLHNSGSLLSPIGGVADIRPGLPNRAHSTQELTSVNLRTGDSRSDKPITLHGEGAAISPAWVYSGYPIGASDHAANSDWVTNYVTESHGQLVSPLRLAPAWEP